MRFNINEMRRQKTDGKTSCHTDTTHAHQTHAPVISAGPLEPLGRGLNPRTTA
jgi:hypothetical protein